MVDNTYNACIRIRRRPMHVIPYNGNTNRLSHMHKSWNGHRRLWLRACVMENRGTREHAAGPMQRWQEGQRSACPVGHGAPRHLIITANLCLLTRAGTLAEGNLTKGPENIYSTRPVIGSGRDSSRDTIVSVEILYCMKPD